MDNLILDQNFWAERGKVAVQLRAKNNIHGHLQLSGGWTLPASSI